MSQVPSGTNASSPAQLQAVRWDGDAPVIVDQRELPSRLVELRLDSTPAVVDAIARLAVRGAPAIGIVGAYGVAAAVVRASPETPEAARVALDAAAAQIGPVRPTAANLSLAVARVRAAGHAAQATAGDVIVAVLAEAHAIHEEDRVACGLIGAQGAALLGGGAGS